MGKRVKASQWFDESKRLDQDPKPKKETLKSVNGFKRPRMVRLGVNSKGQLVSVSRKLFEEMTAKHGEKALILMME